MSVALDAFIGISLRRIDTGEFGVWNRIVQGRINAQVLIMGSSRALTHYDARLVAKSLGKTAYNIGLNGSQSDMQLARIKTYLRHNRKPEVLVHNLDAFAFQVTHGGVYDPGQYVPYLDEPDLYGALARIDPQGTRKARYLPLYGYAAQDFRFGWAQGLRAWLVREKVETHFDGFMPRDRRWTGEFEQFQSRNREGVDIAVEPEGVAQMEELLRLCAAQGIRVVLVYSPEFKPIQAMTRNRQEIFERFRDLAQRHGATMLDYSDSPISSDRANFYNSQHLNATGARAFSIAFAQDLSRVLSLPGAAAPAR